MPDSTQPQCTLPLPFPDDPLERTVLVILRRMAIHGLRDARASWLAIEHFGLSFRQPLVLLRCYMHELASVSNRSIRIAPCCAPGMTRDEGLLMAALGAPALDLLETLTDADDVSRVMTTACAVRKALMEPGDAG